MALAGNSGSAANREEDGREVVPCVVTRSRQEPSAEPHCDKRRAAFPFRTATGTGAADAASRPLARRLSVWVSPFYCERKSPEDQHQQQQQQQK